MARRLLIGDGFRPAGLRWSLTADASHLLDNDAVVKVDEHAESASGAPSPDDLAPLWFQEPRSVRLAFEVTF